jgi:hypothetical protein
MGACVVYFKEYMRHQMLTDIHCHHPSSTNVRAIGNENNCPLEYELRAEHEKSARSQQLCRSLVVEANDNRSSRYGMVAVLLSVVCVSSRGPNGASVMS